MLIQHQNDESMNVVFRLIDKLNVNPEYRLSVQALTVDDSQPNSGIKGNLGLYGTNEWLDNIKNGIIPTMRRIGIIEAIHYIKKDNVDVISGFDIRLPNDEIFSESVFYNDERALAFYKVGAEVDITYILNEEKSRSDRRGGITFYKRVFRIAISG